MVVILMTEDKYNAFHINRNKVNSYVKEKIKEYNGCIIVDYSFKEIVDLKEIEFYFKLKNISIKLKKYEFDTIVYWLEIDGCCIADAVDGKIITFEEAVMINNIIENKNLTIQDDITETYTYFDNEQNFLKFKESMKEYI